MGILLGNVSFFYLTTSIKDNITKTSRTYLLISASLLVFHEFSYTILGKIITITVEILHPPTETENHCRLPLIHITFFYMCVFLTSRTVRFYITFFHKYRIFEGKSLENTVRIMYKCIFLQKSKKVTNV